MKQRNMTSVYLRRCGKFLLLKRQGSRVVNNVWIGSAGGHFENYELNNAKACAMRELEEELGLTDDDIADLNLRYITLRNTAGEVRVNYYFFAELECDKELCSNEGELAWYGAEELCELEMPFTAKFVVEHYIGKGQYDAELYGGVADGREVVFTPMPEF